MPEETKTNRWNRTSYKQVRPDLRRTGLEALGPEKSGGRETAPICRAIVGSESVRCGGVRETGGDRVSCRKEGKWHLELGVALPSVESKPRSN